MMRILSPSPLFFLLALATQGFAANVSLNLSSGYLFGAGGFAESDRLQVTALCVLVADLDGNGFDPVAADGSWVGGGDALVQVTDSEYLAGTFGFDLTSGTLSEAGFFSRTLNVDLAQFGNRTLPVPVALRWFPSQDAATTDLLVTSPTVGIRYGQFSRDLPTYPGTSPWVFEMAGGSILDLDPLATPEFGGIDAPESAMANLTVVPEPATGVTAVFGLALLLVRRRASTC